MQVDIMIQSSRGWLLSLSLVSLAGPPLLAVPLKVLAIGDSLTEEYAFELPFSAPDSSPLNANVKNWPEILATQRADSFSMGSYNSTLFSYTDLRDGGYKYNYGVPGFKTADWVAVCQSSFEDVFSSDLITSLRYPTQQGLLGHLDNVGAVVIFLGGNDLKSDYAGIFNNAQAPALLAEAVTNLTFIHDYVRRHKASVPIIIATAPDIGATAEVAGKYTDPAKRAIARARIAAMNASIIAMAATRGATVARVDTVTDRIFDQVPLELNGTTFNYAPNPENSPRPVFCKDGFHPATMVQALIADQIVDALNRATGSSIPRLANRDILGPILGLNPDQPYLDWASTAGGFTANPDGDGLPNLAEFVLGTTPTVANSPFVFESDRRMHFATSLAGQKFASLTVEESSTLAAWLPVPASRISVALDGVWQISPPAASRTFYRLAVSPRP